MNDIVVLERADEIGGTWRDDAYPGAGCDVPSLLYSYSYEPNPPWTRTSRPPGEIQPYLEDVGAKRDLRKYIRFDQKVRGIPGERTAASGYSRRTRPSIVPERSLPLGPLATRRFPTSPGSTLSAARSSIARAGTTPTTSPVRRSR